MKADEYFKQWKKEQGINYVEGQEDLFKFAEDYANELQKNDEYVSIKDDCNELLNEKFKNDDENGLLTCYSCGIEIMNSGHSLHVWDIEYYCGCKIWGAIGESKYKIESDCPYQEIKK